MLLLLLACAHESVDESAGIALSADDESTKLTIGGARFSLTSGDGPVSRAACPVAADCLTRESELWTEWWSPLARGWEQGFTVPDGGRLVEIPVSVDGATVTATGPRTAKLTVGDTTLRYTGLRAWDARHHDLPAALAVLGNQITLRVDTRDAEFPIVVDPAVVTDWQVGGAETGGALGDINNDGLGEVATVAYDYHSSRYYWTTTVYMGAEGGPSETGTDYSNSYSGASSTFIGGVAPAGDVNADGYNDFIVGIPATAKVYVYGGGASGVDTAAGAIVSSTTSYMGGVVAGVGDTNGDGFDDVAAAQDVNTSSSYTTGEVRIWRGSATSISGTGNTTLAAPARSGNFGDSVSGGDVDGDGFSDVFVGMPGDDTASTDSGMVYMYPGSSSGTSTTSSWNYNGAVNELCGTSVDASRDIDGDGYNDLIVGCGTAATAGYYSGSMRIWHGSAAGLSGSPDLTIDGNSTYDLLGYHALWAGDLNGDGNLDAANGGGSSGATVSIIDGDGSTLSATVTETIEPDDGDSFGYAIGAPGDVDGDGYDDLLVGTEDGTYSLVLGGSTGMVYDWDCDWSWHGYSNEYAGGWFDHGDWDGDGVNDMAIGLYSYGARVTYGLSGGPTAYDFLYASGDRMGAMGDFDGDGLADIVTGDEDYSSANAGQLTFFPGDGTRTATASTWTYTEPTSSANLGADLNRAGDVNGDGIEDLIAGAPYDKTGTVSAGGAQIFWGNSAGFAAAPDWEAFGTANYDKFGQSVTGLGDVDGDGTDDVAVGCPGCDSLGSYMGEVQLFLGGFTGLSATADQVWGLPVAVENYTGYFVDAGGDVNGDGHGDLLVGSYLATDTLTEQGRVDVVMGDSSGLEATSAWTHWGTEESDRCALIASAGDWDGDGRDDVLVEDQTDGVGTVLLYLSSGGSLEDEPAEQFENWGNGYGGGRTFRGVGDINDDGFDDIAVGSPVEDTDEGAARVWYGGALDRDSDGATTLTDCNDTDATVLPGATELCDSIDNDCNGIVDDGSPSWYPDVDGDGYGDDAAVNHDCAMPSGYLAVGGDCDDADTAVNPAATEACGGGDENCDGSVDESGATGSLAVYADADGDGYGAGAIIAACTVAAGFSAVNGDCDDTSASASPAGTEVCNSIDDDCDGTADNGATDALSWFSDGDGDGVGAGGATLACAAPSGMVATDDDCNDADDTIAPGALEVCDGVDQDCDDVVDNDAIDASAWYADDDGDGFGAGSATMACAAPTDTADNATDCDDANPDAYPGATERWYDGVDEDCAGGSDYDRDGDGFDTSSFGGRDCDDSTATISPDAAEVWYDGTDQNCDGNDDDQDADGTPLAADCDDTDPTKAADCSEDSAVVDSGDTAAPVDSGTPAADDTAAKGAGPATPGCGCTSGGDGTSAAGLLVLAALTRRRRRSA